MDAKTFTREVKRRAPEDVSREALEAAIDTFLVEGKREKYHVSDCILAAGALELEELAEGDTTYHLPPHIFPAAQGELLIAQVQPWIESIRQELFGRTAPRFKTYKAAVRWLKSEAASQPQPSKKSRHKARALELEVMERLQELTRLTRLPTKYSVPGPLFIPYGDFPNRQVKYLAVTGDKPLGLLAEKSAQVAKATGFRQVAVVAWILTGIEPVLPGARLRTTARVTMTPAGEITTRQARIEIFSADVETADLMKLCEKARADLRPLRRTEKNRILLEVMTELGDLQDGQEKRAYWEAVRLEYNRRKPKGSLAYKNWWSPRQAFVRLDPMFKKSFPRLEGRQE